MRPSSWFLLSILAATPALADDPFGDLFGDTLDANKKKRLDDVEKAASDVKVGGSQKTLQPKGTAAEGADGVDFLDQFIANRIVITEKEGCIPANTDRMRITYLEYDDYPARSPKVSLCMKMASRANRQVRITASIVNPRLKRVGRADTVVSFAGITKTDHVLDYPEMSLDMVGPYFLAIDLDGKPVAKLPLFEVRQPQ
jgi:hypothetical protein